MAFDIHDDFIHFVIWPHIVVYIFYFFVKYLSTILEPIYHLFDSKVDENSDEENHSLFCLLTCCCFCCCCCNCYCCRHCCNCCNSAENLIKTIIEYNLKFDRWLIKLLLGREEGVVERHYDDYRSDEDSKGKPFAPIYIRNKSLNSTEVSILSTLVFTFGLVIGITAFDIYFLDVSYACTDDKSFSCFVLPVNADNNRNELGITNMQISNCSQWENTNISDQVYVICYKWIYDFKGVSVAVGALLTLFQLTIKAATSIFVSLNDYLLTARRGSKWLKICCVQENFTKKKEKLKRIRRTLAAIVFGIEILLLAINVYITVSYFIGTRYTGASTERFISEHGNQALLMFGIITTCLLLPIEDYAETPTQQQVVNRNQHSGNERYLTNYGSTESSC